jgi:ribosomal protein L37AE/L43A
MSLQSRPSTDEFRAKYDAVDMKEEKTIQCTECKKYYSRGVVCNEKLFVCNDCQSKLDNLCLNPLNWLDDILENPFNRWKK